MTKEELLISLNFKKKYLSDKSGHWYEKVYRIRTGGYFHLTVEFNPQFKNKEIYMFYEDSSKDKQLKWSEKNIRKWDEYFTKIGKIDFS